MALTNSTVDRYINNLRLQQIAEQENIASLRRRGVNYKQYISSAFPILMWTLELNQVSEVLEPNKRDLMIDYLTP